jgi:uncharacterized protein YqhQ
VAGKAHYYGGQAIIEGVMMRGRDHWAVAVRRPDESIHVESHEIKTIASRVRIFRWPFLRGVIALGQALTIGLRALTISANQSVEEENQLSTGQMAVTMSFAFVIFTVVFIIGPFLGFHLLHNAVSSGVERNLLEGLVRVLLFLGYIALIGRLKEIRRVFQYHGAEHKTIAAYEHDDELVPDEVDKYSTLHVRCGTNFLLIVMVLAILVYAFFPAKGILWGILSRVIAIPIIAGISFEMLRLGARFTDSKIMRALMTPGLWLQKITTKPPDHAQIEVAIASFKEVLKREADPTLADGVAAVPPPGTQVADPS